MTAVPEAPRESDGAGAPADGGGRARRQHRRARVAVVGARDEAHCVHMRDLLMARGERVVLIDTNRYPRAATLSYVDGAYEYEGDRLGDLRAVYIRTVFYSLPFYDLDPEMGASAIATAGAESGAPKSVLFDDWYHDYVAERERQSFLTSWLRSLALAGTRVVNPIESFDLHYLKVLQLAILLRAGIPVPRTCATNDPERLRRFAREVGPVVYKPVAGGATCRRLEPTDLGDERLEQLRAAPVIFQEEVPGLNVRVYVAGERVVSAAIIHSEELDYRGTETAIERIALPAEVGDMCRRAMQLCGLVFTGADLRLRPDGSYVLIECNPSPLFLGMCAATGDPIDERLADLLLSGPAAGRAGAPAAASP